MRGLPKLNVVLYQPKIHWNTGNIGRTCLGFNARLHLIKPYGFNIDDKHVKRAGLDYWEKVDLTEYDDWNHFKRSSDSLGKRYLFEIPAKTSLLDVDLWEHDNKTDATSSLCLVFGSETTGFNEIMEDIRDESLVYIPQETSNIRSFNLSNSVSVALWEAHRQYTTRYK